MKLTLIKAVVYIGIIIGIHLLAAYRAGGAFDPFYLRFTNGKHASMIIGTSRAAQALQPAVLDKTLGKEFAPFGNFAFTVAHSPFGENYFQAIKKKTDKADLKKKRGFIIAVNAWALSSQHGGPLQISSALANVTSVDKPNKPNLEYLIKEYPDGWGKILFDPVNPQNMYLHQDGWLEVSIPMDEAAIASRTKEKINAYRRNSLPYYRFSQERYDYLDQTIAFLNQYGKVVLVRLPVIKEIETMENQLIPDFDQKICALTRNCSLPYWSFLQIKDQFEYTDGNHMYKESGARLSQEIARRIKKGLPGQCACE